MEVRDIFKRTPPLKEPQPIGLVVEKSTFEKLTKLAKELKVSRSEVFEFMMKSADLSEFMKEKRISAIENRMREMQTLDNDILEEERKLHIELKQLKNSNNQL